MLQAEVEISKAGDLGGKRVERRQPSRTCVKPTEIDKAKGLGRKPVPTACTCVS